MHRKIVLVKLRLLLLCNVAEHGQVLAKVAFAFQHFLAKHVQDAPRVLHFRERVEQARSASEDLGFFRLVENKDKPEEPLQRGDLVCFLKPGFVAVWDRRVPVVRRQRVVEKELLRNEIRQVRRVSHGCRVYQLVADCLEASSEPRRRVRQHRRGELVPEANIFTRAAVCPHGDSASINLFVYSGQRVLEPFAGHDGEELGLNLELLSRVSVRCFARDGSLGWRNHVVEPSGEAALLLADKAVVHFWPRRPLAAAAAALPEWAAGAQGCAQQLEPADWAAIRHHGRAGTALYQLEHGRLALQERLLSWRAHFAARQPPALGWRHLLFPVDQELGCGAAAAAAPSPFGGCCVLVSFGVCFRQRFGFEGFFWCLGVCMPNKLEREPVRAVAERHRLPHVPASKRRPPDGHGNLIVAVNVQARFFVFDSLCFAFVVDPGHFKPLGEGEL